MFRSILVILFFPLAVAAQPQYPATPDTLYGKLFREVQLKRVFPDSKTFVDCIPVADPVTVMKRYRQESSGRGFRPESFVRRIFRLPATAPVYRNGTTTLRSHIEKLWQVLRRPADPRQAKGSSLLRLPYPYIVPGGRFREIYYWDSYFTMLGLKESRQYDLMENMVRNFAYLVDQYGHVPNGNRSYYLSRSQPPFFSLMVELLASVKGEAVYTTYAAALKKELQYWTQKDMAGNGPAWMFYVMETGDTIRLAHYYDALNMPRQESYYEDVMTAQSAVTAMLKYSKFRTEDARQRAIDYTQRSVWHNLRSAAASGWDFSSRWFIGGDSLYDTKVSEIVPVDLNCLLWHLRNTSAHANNTDNKDSAIQRSARKLYRDLFFNDSLGWYCDRSSSGMILDNPTLAGMYPLFFRLADEKDVPRIVDYLKRHFLEDGGVVTSLRRTGQQWDAPNGWAPLQWITITGLENYGYHDLAKEIAKRWVMLNKKVYDRTGRLMEKYDVTDLSKVAGGGEYPSQDGFGWTNGVLLALMNKYGL